MVGSRGLTAAVALAVLAAVGGLVPAAARQSTPVAATPVAGVVDEVLLSIAVPAAELPTG